MSISILATDLKRAHDLFVLLREKTAFELVEFEDAGRVFKSIMAALEKAGDSPEGELDSKDVNYVLNAINVCSVRVGVGMQNYKLIADLFETLSAALKGDAEESSEEEETKSE